MIKYDETLPFYYFNITQQFTSMKESRQHTKKRHKIDRKLNKCFQMKIVFLTDAHSSPRGCPAWRIQPSGWACARSRLCCSCPALNEFHITIIEARDLHTRKNAWILQAWCYHLDHSIERDIFHVYSREHGVIYPTPVTQQMPPTLRNTFDMWSYLFVSNILVRRLYTQSRLAELATTQLNMT